MTETPETLADRMHATAGNRLLPLWVRAEVREAAATLDAKDAQIAEQAAEIERLNAVAGPSGKSLGELEAINDDLVAANERLGAALDALSDAWNKRNEQQASGSCCAERDAQIEALRADAERWQKWLPWMRNINRKPYGLAREIDAIDAAMAAKEPK